MNPIKTRKFTFILWRDMIDLNVSIRGMWEKVDWCEDRHCLSNRVLLSNSLQQMETEHNEWQFCGVC